MTLQGFTLFWCQVPLLAFVEGQPLASGGSVAPSIWTAWAWMAVTAATTRSSSITLLLRARGDLGVRRGLTQPRSSGTLVGVGEPGTSKIGIKIYSKTFSNFSRSRGSLSPLWISPLDILDIRDIPSRGTSPQKSNPTHAPLPVGKITDLQKKPIPNAAHFHRLAAPGPLSNRTNKTKGRTHLKSETGAEEKN